MEKLIYTITFLLLCSGVFTGCISEKNQDDCPTPAEGNVTLIFSLPDNNGREVLTEHIENIDLILFRNGAQYQTHRLKASGLGPSRSIVADLEPGTYSVVAWGNLDGNLRMSELSDRMHPDLGRLSWYSAQTGDSLWYAACAEVGLTRTINPSNLLHTYEVPETGSVVETIYFKHAHKLIDVHVRGYSVEGLLPVIQVAGDHEGYDFYMNHVGEPVVTLTQASVPKETTRGEMANASFFTTRLNYDNTVYINIVNPITDAVVYSVPVKEVLEILENFDLDMEITIPVYIECFDGSFEVKPATWLTTPSKPGLD